MDGEAVTSAQLVNADGENALATGDYTRAQSVFSAAIANVGKQPALEGYLRTALGEALLWQGKTSEAAKEFKRASSLVNTAFAAGDDQRARLLDDMAWLYQSQNKMSNAVDAANQSLELRRANANVNPFLLMSSLGHVAYLMDLTGKLEQSSSFYKEAVAVAEKTYGPQSILAADIKEQLGSVLRRMGHGDEATRYYNEALVVKQSTNAALTRFTPHAYWDDVVFRYLEGEPNCARQFSNGSDRQIITANGITIAAGLAARPADFTKSRPVEISVRNDSGAPIQFMSQPPSFDVLAPKVEVAHLVDTSQLANKVEKQGERKAKWIKFWGADATMPVTQTFVGSQGNFWGYPPIYSYGAAPPNVVRNGNVTTVTTQVPDYAAQAKALARAQEAIDKTRDAAAEMRAQALGPSTIPAGGTISGSLYFDSQNVQKALLRVPVGNAVFEFEFPPK
jgi:hypothetical protein